MDTKISLLPFCKIQDHWTDGFTYVCSKFSYVNICSELLERQLNFVTKACHTVYDKMLRCGKSH